MGLIRTQDKYLVYGTLQFNTKSFGSGNTKSTKITTLAKTVLSCQITINKSHHYRLRLFLIRHFVLVLFLINYLLIMTGNEKFSDLNMKNTCRACLQTTEKVYPMTTLELNTYQKLTEKVILFNYCFVQFKLYSMLVLYISPAYKVSNFEIGSL